MVQISKGANVVVNASRLRADLRWLAGAGVPSVDVSALLLGVGGKVAGDDDFVFYNQPGHPSGSVRHVGKTAGDQFCDSVDIDLGRVPGAVDRIVLAASADDGTFGQVPGLELAIIDVDSSGEVAVFAMTADAETAFVCGEVYRREGAWKFRAVGQGYSSGLAGLATDFGISVESPDDSAAGTPTVSEPAQDGEPAPVSEPAPAADELPLVAPIAPPVNSNWPFPTPPPPGLAPPGLSVPEALEPPQPQYAPPPLPPAEPQPQYAPPPPPPAEPQPQYAPPPPPPAEPQSSPPPPPPTPRGAWPAPNPLPGQ